MRFQAVEFITSAARPADFPREDYPEIAMVGRSNVGKSSLINRLVGADGLARVSSTPGKTRLINFFKITPVRGSAMPFYLVDLPGYGYAKVSRETRSAWPALIEGYLAHRSALAGIVALVDLRHGPSPLDEQLDRWIRPLELPVIRVVSKADLLTHSARAAALKRWRESRPGAEGEELMFVSARTGEGGEALLRRMLEWAEDRRSRGGLGIG